MTKLIGARKCSHCDNVMDEGYIIESLDKYFCAEECFESYFNPDELKDVKERDDTYWTQWDLESEKKLDNFSTNGEALFYHYENTLNYISDLISYDDLDEDDKLESIKEYIKERRKDLE